MLTSYLYKLNHFDSDYYESKQDGNSELFALSVMAYLLPPYCPPLYYAILNRDIDAVKLLIDYGADIDTKPKMDWTRTGHFAKLLSHFGHKRLLKSTKSPLFLKSTWKRMSLNLKLPNASCQRDAGKKR